MGTSETLAAGVAAGDPAGDVVAMAAGLVVWPLLCPALAGVVLAEHADKPAAASKTRPASIPRLFQIARIVSPMSKL